MLGKDLVRLAAISALAKTDLAPRDVLLQASGGVCTATYSGVFIRGYIKVAASVEIPPCLVKPDKLAGVAALFPSDADVNVKVQQSGLQLSTRDRRVQLQYTLSETVSAPEIAVNVRTGVVVPRESLQSEITLASEFTTDRAQLPVLAGVRLIYKERLTVSAFDGASGFYLSAVQPNAQGDSFDVTVQYADTLIALNVVRSDEVRLNTGLNTKGDIASMIFSSTDNDVAVSVSIINGTWPNIASMLKEQDGVKLKISTERLMLVNQAIRSLKPANGQGIDWVTIETNEEGVIVARTEAYESGGFSVAIGESEQKLKAVFDANVLKLAAKLADEIEMLIAFGQAPVSVRSDHRRIWIPVRSKEL